MLGSCPDPGSFNWNLGSPLEEGRHQGLTFSRTTTFPRKSSCPLSLRASLKILKGTDRGEGGEVPCSRVRGGEG